MKEKPKQIISSEAEQNNNNNNIQIVKCTEAFNSNSNQDKNYVYNREQNAGSQMAFAEGNLNLENDFRNIQASPNNILTFNNYPNKFQIQEKQFQNNLNLENQFQIQRYNYVQKCEDNLKHPKELYCDSKEIQEINNYLPHSPKDDYYKYINMLNNDFNDKVPYNHPNTLQNIHYNNIPVVIDPQIQNNYYPYQGIYHDEYPNYYNNIKSTSPQKRQLEYLENQKSVKETYQPRIILENRYIYPITSKQKFQKNRKVFEESGKGPEILQNKNLNNLNPLTDENEFVNVQENSNELKDIKINRQTLMKEWHQFSPEKRRENYQIALQQKIHRYKATPTGGIKS